MTIDFDDLLEHIPPPGQGFNPYLFKLACAAHRDGCVQDDFVELVLRFTPPGERSPREGEIIRAYLRARDPDAVITGPEFDQQPLDRLGLLTAIEEGRECPPLPTPAVPYDRHVAVFLEASYALDDVLWVGSLVKGSGRAPKGAIRPVRYWIQASTKPIWRAAAPNLMIINPLGDPDAESPFSDAAVTRYRYTILEFDNLHVHDQIAFWQYVAAHGMLDIHALVFSGSKSVHCWVKLPEGCTRDEYHLHVGKIFTTFSRYGVDTTTRNPANRARLPGGRRAPGLRSPWQCLLYLKGC